VDASPQSCIRAIFQARLLRAHGYQVLDTFHAFRRARTASHEKRSRRTALFSCVPDAQKLAAKW